MGQDIGYCRIGDFVLDPVERRIRRGEQSWPLTPKPLGVLLALTRRPREIVTREELLAEIWPGVRVEGDSLERCIRDLRKILGDSSRSPHFIETVHGVGYRLIAPVSEDVQTVDTTYELPRPSRPKYVLHWSRWALVPLVPVLIAAWRIASPPAAPFGEAAWWTFDEPAGLNVRDVSGGGNSGRIVNGTQRIKGVRGGALEFDGVGGHVVGEGPGALPTGDSPRTIAAWLRVDGVPGQDSNIFHYGTSSAHGGPINFHLYLSTEGRLGLGNGYGHGSVEAGRPLGDSKWHHVAGVYQGRTTNQVRIHVDGVELGSKTIPTTPNTGKRSPWTVGLFMGGGSSLRGAIDDLRVYARALTAIEILTLHRCTSNHPDLSLPGNRNGYFLPVFEFPPLFSTRGENEASTPIAFGGMEHEDETPRGGVQFAAGSADCSMDSLRGATLPYDLRFRSEIKVQSAGKGHLPEAGPLLRMSSLRPGQSMDAATNGYWVRLDSKGSVNVFSLEGSGSPILYRGVPSEQFDDSAFHWLEVTIRSERMRVSLDSQPVVFERDGRKRAWAELPATPREAAAAGIGFVVSGKPLTGRMPAVRNISLSSPN
jgi:DNA-binding winged helix-turn-helix (wHTH) protein